MSSAEYLREFVNKRLTAAAEEIFGVFIKTIVCYEEEIDRQRRLLDFTWKPEIRLRKIVSPEFARQHVFIEDEVPPEKQLCIQKVREQQVHEQQVHEQQIQEQQIHEQQIQEQQIQEQQVHEQQVHEQQVHEQHIQEQQVHEQQVQEQQVQEQQIQTVQAEPPQVKQEHEGLISASTSQGGEQLVLKQETGTFMLAPTYKESDHGENQTQNINPDDTLRAAEKDSGVSLPEEEIARQRRLLDIIWKPEIRLHRIELTQQHVFIEAEVPPEKQLCIQEVQEQQVQTVKSEPPQIKREHEELISPSTSQGGEQLVLKQETGTFMLAPTYKESDHGENQTQNINPDDTLRAAEKDSGVSLPVIVSVVSESDHQLLSDNSQEAERQKKKKCKHRDPRSIRNQEPEPEPKKICRQSGCQRNNVSNLDLSEIQRNTHSGESFKCDTCGKDFQSRGALINHIRIHGRKNVTVCKFCKKRFFDSSTCRKHMKNIHKRKKSFHVHMTTAHTGEKPYACKTCEKKFSDTSTLKRHMRFHIGEKLHTCETCGKSFRCSTVLLGHMRTHTDDRPYFCKSCGKDFRSSTKLLLHIGRAHTGEKPFACKTCGKGFSDLSTLAKHVRIHTDK